MPVITEFAAGGLRVCAFMDMIAHAEGTSSSPITVHDGYDVIVNSIDATGKVVRNRFDDYSKHPFADGRPSLRINSKGLTSNASGRYQFMLKDWSYYKDLCRLPDFGPLSQDRWCIQLLKERKAIGMILDGDFECAVRACSNIWASLPGPGNTYGQPQRAMDSLKAFFLLNGGA